MKTFLTTLLLAVAILLPTASFSQTMTESVQEGALTRTRSLTATGLYSESTCAVEVVAGVQKSHCVTAQRLLPGKAAAQLRAAMQHAGHALAVETAWAQRQQASQAMSSRASSESSAQADFADAHPGVMLSKAIATATSN